MLNVLEEKNVENPFHTSVQTGPLQNIYSRLGQACEGSKKLIKQDLNVSWDRNQETKVRDIISRMVMRIQTEN